MNHRSIILAASIGVAGFSLHAKPVDLSKLPPAASKTGVTYESDIRPLFEASCVRCHGNERPKGGLKLSSLEGVLKGSKDGKVVVPGSSEKSQLVIAVSQLDPESAMPPKPRGRRGPGGPGAPGGAGNPPSAAQPNSPAGGPPPADPHGPGAPGEGGPGGPGGQPPHKMGPPPKPLTAEQVGLVRAWIDQGAK